jgi:hypothetical protein
VANRSARVGTGGTLLRRRSVRWFRAAALAEAIVDSRDRGGQPTRHDSGAALHETQTLAMAQLAAVRPLTAVLPEPAAGAEHLTRHLGAAQKYRSPRWSRRCCPTRGGRDRVNPLLLAAVESSAQPWAQP